MNEGTVAPTLLKNWGKRLSKNRTPIVPIFIGGSWRLTVNRGNKRALRLVVPGKGKPAANKARPEAITWSVK